MQLVRTNRYIAFGFFFTAIGAMVVPGANAAAGRSAMSTLVKQAKKGKVIPPVIDDVEVLCSMLTGCSDVAFPKPANDFPTCVKTTWSALASPDTLALSLRLRACALQANSCSQMRACALGGAKEDVCKGRAMKSKKPIGFCDLDGRAVSCFRGKALFVRDCPIAGEQCSVIKGKPVCSLGPCPTSLPSGKSACSADHKRVLTCSDNRLKSQDCSLLGLACEEDSKGKPYCVPVTPKCESSVSSCSGNAAKGCFRGHKVDVMCSSAQMSCALPHDPDAIGVCSPGKEIGGPCKLKRARCRGGVIRYCLNGHERRFLCKAFGFRGCENRRDGPVCVP